MKVQSKAFGAVGFTMFMSRFIKMADSSPGWKVPMIFGWTGMRGVVSLAAALSVPVLMSNGQPFPYRNLVLFITFVVILVTLVLQGLTLPWLIRKLNLIEKEGTISEAEQEKIIQKKLTHYSLQYLDEKYGADLSENEHFNILRSKLKAELNYFDRQLEETYDVSADYVKKYQQLYLQMLEELRKLLDKINHKAEFDEDLVRKYLTLIDMEEFKTRESNCTSILIVS